jgi:hypothetical protein
MKLQKQSFRNFHAIKSEEFVLFGSGNIAKKTMLKLDKKVKFIVDNSKNLQGTSFEGIEVKSPDQIGLNHVVIICSTAITEISQQLISMGLTPNVNFLLSPVLNDLLAIEELEKLSTSFYFTSGSVPTDAFGGGFYHVNIEHDKTSIKRIYAGPCYGSTRINNKIYFIDTDKGVMSFDTRNKSISLEGTTPKGSRAHGISYNNWNNSYYVTCSYLDAVIEYDVDFNETRRFVLSNKLEQTNTAAHHCNDNLAIGSSLFVTMFSSSGNWKKDVFDGCVAEFDLVSGERLRDVHKDLFMPHNIMSFDGSLHVLDSLPGHLRAFNFQIQGTFPAFTRGLAYHKGLYYVGQSKNRNFSKALGLTNNISIDCGIIVWHPEIKVSRFIQISEKIGEVHSITH